MPRDLETICLACLRKKPQDRYATAALLAEDLRRFERGEPVTASRANVIERSVKWMRRRPAVATATIGGGVVASVFLGTLLWFASERAAVAHAAEQDLREAIRLQHLMSWSEAKTALDRAEMRLNDGGPAALRERLAAARRDSAFVGRLEAIRLNRADSTAGLLNDRHVDQSCADLFRDAGLVLSDDESPQLIAARISSSSIAPALLDAVDVWLLSAGEDKRIALLQKVAELLDPSPLRRQIADRSAFASQESVDQLVKSIDVSTQSPMLLVALGERISVLGMNAVPLLRALQRTHPADFWVNLTLADALIDQRNPVEAIRFYQAAIVLRPGTSLALNNMANTLGALRRYDEAIDAYRLALASDLDGGIIRLNLASTLTDAGHSQEAVDFSRSSLMYKGAYPQLRFVAVEGLMQLGESEKAIEELKAATTVSEIADEAHGKLRACLIRFDRLPEAMSDFKAEMEGRPVTHAVWDGYAELCLFAGDSSAYEDAATQLLERFGDDPDPSVSERTGRACLLKPCAPAIVARATAAIERAMRSQDAPAKSTWQKPYFMVARALAAYRADDFTLCLSILDDTPDNVLTPMSQLIRAMAAQRTGDSEAAKAALLRAARAIDWDPAVADTREKWLYHVLRREAETLIIPDLTMLLNGQRLPADGDERAILIAALRGRRMFAPEARQWAALEEDDPAALAQKRVAAARSAAGAIADASLSAEERKADRQRAVRWLDAEAGVLEAYLAASQRTSASVATEVRQWLNDPAFATIRTEASLQAMAPDERQACSELWDRVQTLANPQ